MFIFDEKILEEISKLEGEDLKRYISSRIQFLEDNATENRDTIETGIFSKTALSHGFIPSTTEICAETGMGRVAIGGFLLNDNEIYEILINNLKKQDSTHSLNDILQAIQNSIDEYFGGLALEDNEINRTNLYFKMQEKYEFDAHPISEYRNNNTALCTERAAIGQNMLAFLGADTYYMMGHLSRSDGKTNMNHAYNCVVDREYGSGIVVDFTNPILRERLDEMYVFNSSIINKNAISRFLTGEYQVEMERPEYYMQDEKEMRKTIYCNYSLNSLNRNDITELQNKKSKVEEIEDARRIISTTEIGKTTMGTSTMTKDAAKGKVSQDIGMTTAKESKKEGEEL